MSDTATCLTSTGTAPQTFSAAVQFFAAAQCLVTEPWPADIDLVDETSYDFIIVGAGSAGSVLANRLSEVPSWKVLLLEAGTNPPCESIVPHYYTSLMNTKYDWNYTTVNDGVSNQALVNGHVSWPTGKMLGGCSSMNAMYYIRGSTYDYMGWYNEGNELWHPDVTTKYFNVAESLQDQSLLKNSSISDHYGQTGPLVVNTYNSTYRDITYKLLDSYDAIGIKRQTDLNSVNNLGAGIYRATAANGTRRSTAKSYLNPIASSRTNLDISKDSFVTRILFDENLVAYGVEVNRSGTIMTFNATREVIVSAGAINTPQILMLSGIGPKDHLESKGITTLVDSPMVGQNLQDHPYVPVLIYADEPEPLSKSDEYISVFKYLHDRSGLLATPVYSDITALYAVNSSAKYADFQNHFGLFYKNSSLIKSFIAARYVESVANGIIEESFNKSVFEFALQILHPYSKGNISLNSNSPYDSPLIYYNYFEDSRDLDNVAIGAKMLTKIVDTPYFQSIGAKLGRMNYSDCNGFELDSTDYWKCVSYSMSITLSHQSGTTRMGTDISTGVVDGSLKVHGVTGLRVIDAGIMPTVTSGNTNAPTIMIGERASDIIKTEYDQTDYCKIV